MPWLTLSVDVVLARWGWCRWFVVCGGDSPARSVLSRDDRRRAAVVDAPHGVGRELSVGAACLAAASAALRVTTVSVDGAGGSCARRLHEPVVAMVGVHVTSERDDP